MVLQQTVHHIFCKCSLVGLLATQHVLILSGKRLHFIKADVNVIPMNVRQFRVQHRDAKIENLVWLLTAGNYISVELDTNALCSQVPQLVTIMLIRMNGRGTQLFTNTESVVELETQWELIQTFLSFFYRQNFFLLLLKENSAKLSCAKYARLNHSTINIG